MKKGFTLVEMSIVLVIIGVLMGLVVKGKSLIESAKYTKEWAIMRSIGIALESYSADNGGILKGTRIGDFVILDTRKFMNYASMSEDEFKSHIFEDTYYTPMLLTKTARGDYFYVDPSQATLNFNKTHLLSNAISPGVYSTKTLFMTTSQDYKLVPVKGLCRLENAFDDRNFFSGKLRFFAEELGNFATVRGNCDDYENSSTYPNQDFAVSFFD